MMKIVSTMMTMRMIVTSPKSSGAHLPFVFDALGLDRSQCSLQSSAQMRMMIRSLLMMKMVKLMKNTTSAPFKARHK